MKTSVDPAETMDNEKSLLDNILNSMSRVWVFGYGSILWKTGFDYNSRKIGQITGFARRFWQGSTSHRGTPQNPGRVATLVPEEGCKVWGAAYELVGKEMIHEALDHLGVRECLLGGYVSVMTPFQERDMDCEPFPVLMFTATPSNSMFLGAASLEDLATQIIGCQGPCGHNIEYVTQLADYMAEHIQEETDPHLFGLVDAIEQNLASRGLCKDTLIQEAKLHKVPTNTVCAKCNALCSEYAFCAKCREDTVKEALTCGNAESNSSTTKQDSLHALTDVDKPAPKRLRKMSMNEKLITVSAQ